MHFLQTLTYSIATSAVKWNHSHWNTTTPETGPTATLTESLFKSISSASSQVVEIVVGAAGKPDFNPKSLTATPGTVLRFNFLSRNHTLTQSLDSHPCRNGSHFDTGFDQSNPSNVSGYHVVDYTVRSTDPVWFHCAQIARMSHCEAGMVFSLNPHLSPPNSTKDSTSSSSTKPQCNATSGVPIATTSRNASFAKPTSINPENTNVGSNWRLGLTNLLGILILNFL